MLAPCGSSRYVSCTSGYACSDSAVTSSRPSSAHSFNVWMSRSTCSNSKPRVSTRPSASAQNMNASSGSGLCPRRISMAGHPSSEGAYTSAVTNVGLTDAIQHYLRDIYKLTQEDGRVSVTSLARRLGVSPASASAMVKKLAALELAAHAPYKGVALTP